MSTSVPFSSAAATKVVLNQPRIPKSFHGDTFEDVEDCLDHFERVAEHNGWTPRRKLRNAYFALEDYARTWFENREAALSTCHEFRRQLISTCASLHRKERAESAIQVRVQRPNESVALFVEDMCQHFRRADPSMPDEKKLMNLMRGVKQELFGGLIRNPPKTIAEFLAEAIPEEKPLQQPTRR